MVHSDRSSDEEIYALSQSVYTPSDGDILNYTTKIGAYKTLKAVDVINKNELKVTQSGFNSVNRTGYTYVNFFIIKRNAVASRDKAILNTVLLRYYAIKNQNLNN